MKKTLVFYSLICILFSASHLSAQVSGYMGKRLIGIYDSFTNIYYPLNNKAPDNPFSVRHSVGLDYTVSRNISVSTSLTFSEPLFFSNNEKGSLFNKGFALGASVFSDDGLAPLGYFVKYQLHYYKSEYTVYIEDYFYDIFGNQRWGKVNKKGNINNLVLNCVIGQSAVVFDRLFINYGFQFGYRVGTVFGNITDLSDYSTEAEIKSDVRRRNLMHNLWGVQFGIGYLIY